MKVPNELLTRYLERRKQDLEDCKRSFETKNFVFIQRVGHQLKGNGVTFGHPELSRIGNKLEDAALLKDLLQVDKALKDFAYWVKDNTNLNSSL